MGGGLAGQEFTARPCSVRGWGAGGMPAPCSCGPPGSARVWPFPCSGSPYGHDPRGPDRMTRPLLVRSHLTGLVRVVRGGRGARLREHALAFHAHDPRGRAHTCTRTRTRTVASRALCRPRSEPALAPSQVSSRCCPEPGHLCLEPAAGERARQGGRKGGSLGTLASHVAPRPPGLAGPSLHHVHSPQGPGPELLICFPARPHGP